ncbi:MAG: hypothetical protein AAF617_09990 [Bacteroidota bacterium]
MLRDLIQYLKPFIKTIVFITVLLLLNFYVIAPYLDTKYLDLSLGDYDSYSWKYSAYVVGTVFIIFVLIGIYHERNVKEFFGTISVLFLYCVFLFVLLIHPIGQLNLVANTWFESETFHEVYKVTQRKDGTISLRTEDNSKYIFRTNTLERLNKIREEQKLPPAQNTQDGDTIMIKFSKGYLDDIGFVK